MKKSSGRRSVRSTRKSKQKNCIGKETITPSTTTVNPDSGNIEQQADAVSEALEEFVAARSTFLKASIEQASSLPTHERVSIASGGILSCRVIGENAGHCEFIDGIFNGQKLPAEIRFFAKSHWRRAEQKPG